MSLLAKLGLPPLEKPAIAATAKPVPVATIRPVPAAEKPRIEKSHAANGPGTDPGASLGWGDQIKQGLRKQLDDAKGSAREALLTGLGTAKGMVTQGTEAADTVMWSATELRDGARKLQDKAHDFVAGEKGSKRREVMDRLFAAPPQPEQPSMNPIETLAKMSDEAKKAGWKDERGNASVTSVISKKLDSAARWVEEKVGGTPADPEVLSTMDKAELRAAVGTQVALAFAGVEEVKLLMNSIGAAAATKAIVESYREKGDQCFKDPALWSGVIGVGLTMAGIKNTGAAAKLAAAAQKYGWMVAAIPPLTQMCMDALDPKIIDEKEHQARVKRNMTAALNIVKDVLLHKITQAGGKAPEGGDGAHPAASAASQPTAATTAKSSMPETPVATQPAEPHPTAALGMGKSAAVGVAPVEPAASQPVVQPTLKPPDLLLPKPPAKPSRLAPQAAGNDSVKVPAAMPEPAANLQGKQPSTDALKKRLLEGALKAANDNAELPENVVPMRQPKPKAVVQEQAQARPLKMAAGAERMSAVDGQGLKVMANAKGSGESGTNSGGTSGGTGRMSTTESGAKEPSPQAKATAGKKRGTSKAASADTEAPPSKGEKPKSSGKARPPANDNTRPPVSAISKLRGMQKFMGRLEESGFKLDDLDITPQKLNEMAEIHRNGLADRLETMLKSKVDARATLAKQSDEPKLTPEQKLEEGTPVTDEPNKKAPKKKTEAGNFAHKFAEHLNDMIRGASGPSIDKLKPGMQAEFSVPDPRRPPKEWQRIDRVDWKDGVVVEIGPSRRRAEKLQEAKNYAAMLDETHPLDGNRKWTPRVVTYDQKQVLDFLHRIGYFE